MTDSVFGGAVTGGFVSGGAVSVGASVVGEGSVVCGNEVSVAPPDVCGTVVSAGRAVPAPDVPAGSVRLLRELLSPGLPDGTAQEHSEIINIIARSGNMLFFIFPSALKPSFKKVLRIPRTFELFFTIVYTADSKHPSPDFQKFLKVPGKLFSKSFLGRSGQRPRFFYSTTFPA